MSKLGAGTRHGSLEAAQLVPEMTAGQYPQTHEPNLVLISAPGEVFLSPHVMIGQT